MSPHPVFPLDELFNSCQVAKQCRAVVVRTGDVGGGEVGLRESAQDGKAPRF